MTKILHNFKKLPKIEIERNWGQTPLNLLLWLSSFDILSWSIGDLKIDRAPNLWNFSFFHYFSIGVEKIIFEMWRFLYRILCISVSWERISTRKIKKISFTGLFGLKTVHFHPNPPVIVSWREIFSFEAKRSSIWYFFVFSSRYSFSAHRNT